MKGRLFIAVSLLASSVSCAFAVDLPATVAPPSIQAGSWVLMDPATQITILYMHQSIPNREEYIHPRIRNIVYAHLG